MWFVILCVNSFVIYDFLPIFLWFWLANTNIKHATDLWSWPPIPSPQIIYALAFYHYISEDIPCHIVSKPSDQSTISRAPDHCFLLYSYCMWFVLPCMSLNRLMPFRWLLSIHRSHFDHNVNLFYFISFRLPRLRSSFRNIYKYP